MGKIENKPMWICDKCKKEHVGDRPPNRPSDAWGKLKIDQDAGWDASGSPWCPRMRKPILLCGDCIEKIFATINGDFEKLQHHKDSTVGLWATDKPNLLTDEEKEKFHMFEIK